MEPGDLTAREVARALHVHVNTVKRLVADGELPAYRINKRGDLRFRAADLETFRAKHAAPVEE